MLFKFQKIYSEYQKNNYREEKDNNLANKNENEEAIRNDKGGIGILSEGSNSVLQGTQPIQRGRVSVSETGYEQADSDINSQHETAQESTSGTTEVALSSNKCRFS